MGDAGRDRRRPSAVRYPRAKARHRAAGQRTPLEIGKGRIVAEGTKIALLSFGTRLQNV